MRAFTNGGGKKVRRTEYPEPGQGLWSLNHTVKGQCRGEHKCRNGAGCLLVLQ